MSSLPPAPRSLFENIRREHDFEEVAVQGVLPPELQGTLYRNGVGQMEQFGRRYQHLFEADGAISALRLHEGKAQAAARLVQSVGLLQERHAGRHLGSFAAAWPTRLRRIHSGRLKNTANTHIVPFQGRLLALMEGGKPTEMDPESLATLGETDLQGLIQGAFSAHPHEVRSHKTTYGFGLEYGRETKLHVYALPNSGPGRRLCQLTLPRPVMMHDFIATEKHLVFFVCPMQVVVWRMMMAMPGFANNFRWIPREGTEIIVVPIANPEAVVRFHTDAFHTFHFAGAFEDGEQIVVDYVRYADAAIMGELGDGMSLTWSSSDLQLKGGILHRARITPTTRHFTSEARWDQTCEFPRIADRVQGQRFEHIWMHSETSVDGLRRHRITRINGAGQVVHHLLDPGEHCSEPVPAQAAGGAEAAGSILSLVYSSTSDRSHLLVLDASTLHEQARVPLSQPIPLTFHGSWVPDSARGCRRS